MLLTDWRLANFEELWRCEEHHLRREPINRVDQDPLLDDLIVEAAPLRGNSR